MSRAKSAETMTKAAKAESRSAWWSRYRASLRYALYVITHPFDGFWDLNRENKGTLAAANTFLALFLITRVLKILCTSFQFFESAAQHINVFEEMGSLLLPFLILCLANWAMIQLPMILVSHMLTFEEGSLYSVMLVFSVIWSVFLVFVGLMEIHDYGPGKTFIFIIVTIVGAAVIIFLVLVFFSLLSDAVGFFVSLYREAAYRLN